MSLSTKNLSFIQKAGQAVHGASVAIAATLRSQAESMVASVASQPFGVESEQSIARFKVLARLSQGLDSVEAQLQELYAVASDLANPASDVIVLSDIKKHKASNNAAIDVVAKPAKAPKLAKKNANTPPRKAVEPGLLTRNDSILLQYLQTNLKADTWTALTGAAMAAGSSLPLGSVGISLRKILASGAVKSGARGTYLLGAHSAAVAQAAVAAKKAKSAVAKKGKPAPSESPVAGAKVKPSNKAKAGKNVKSAATPVADVPAQTPAVQS